MCRTFLFPINPEGPEPDYNTISNICWPKWNSLNDKQKKRFDKMASSDVQRYDQEMKKYNEAKKANRGKPLCSRVRI